MVFTGVHADIYIMVYTFCIDVNFISRKDVGRFIDNGISAFFAKAAGAATAASLYASGVITAAQATILLMPSMLMGTLVGHYARLVLVAGTSGKYRLIMIAIPIIDSIIGMFLMKTMLTVMGLM
ncbi:MAG: hypothetical protein ACI8WT_004418 [Clostridium sp.]|jgi:hypothetical protein